MDKSDGTFISILVILGLGGLVVWWFINQPQPAPAQQPCGVPISVYGVGANVPCSVIKGAVEEVSKAATNIPVLSTFVPLDKDDCPFLGYTSTGSKVPTGQRGGLACYSDPKCAQACNDWKAGKKDSPAVRDMQQRIDVRASVPAVKSLAKDAATRTDGSWRGTVAPKL